MKKFKVGDKVRCIDKDSSLFGEEDIVRSIPGMGEYDGVGYKNAERGFCLKESGWEYQGDWEKVGGNK